jgi:hypothetical protein
VIVAVIGLAESGVIAPAATPSSPLPVTITVLTDGTVWTIGPWHYQSVGSVNLTSNKWWTLNGTFTSTAYVQM